MQSTHTSWIIRFSYSEAMDIIKSQKGKQQLLYEGCRYRCDKLNQIKMDRLRGDALKDQTVTVIFSILLCLSSRFCRRDFIVANLSARFWRRVLIGAILSARICLSRNCRVTPLDLRLNDSCCLQEQCATYVIDSLQTIPNINVQNVQQIPGT